MTEQFLGMTYKQARRFMVTWRAEIMKEWKGLTLPPNPSPDDFHNNALQTIKLSRKEMTITQIIKFLDKKIEESK